MNDLSRLCVGSAEAGFFENKKKIVKNVEKLRIQEKRKNNIGGFMWYRLVLWGIEK